MQTEIDFKEIRPLGGKKYNGFEELTVQIFRREFPDSFLINRIEGSGGDGGLEAYTRKSHYGIVGLQSKYIFKLGGKKSQISRSVITALEKFPNVRKIIFTFPFDRNRNEIELWKSWVNEWRLYAKRNNIKNLSIVWWGASELRDILTSPLLKGKIEFWFGLPEFDQEWLKNRFRISKDQLDTRYSPNLNIVTESLPLLKSFIISESFKKLFLDQVKKLIEKSNWFFGYDNRKTKNETICKFTRDASIKWENFLDLIGDGKIQPNFERLIDKCNSLKDIIESADRYLGSLHYKNKKPNDPLRWHDSPWRDRYIDASNFNHQLHLFINFCNFYSNWANQYLIVTGEAGSGKSHLLASLLDEIIQEKGVALLLLGFSFINLDDPWEQLKNEIGWENSIENLLHALDTQAEIKGSIGVICIDAINESDNKELWKNKLQSFAERLVSYKNLKLIISCRSDFLEICTPSLIHEKTIESWSYLKHEGFAQLTFKAISHFFKEYNIQTDYFPPSFSEFSNPLFLKTFCETYENTHLKIGAMPFTKVLSDYQKKKCKEIAHIIDCDIEDLFKAIRLVSNSMVERKQAWIPLNEAKELVNSVLPGRVSSKSVYIHLRSSGIFYEQYSNISNEERLRFSFEKFHDFIIAQTILAKFEKLIHITRAFQKDGSLYYLVSSSKSSFENRGLIHALSIIIPDKFGVELINATKQKHGTLAHEFLNSLRWRNKKSINNSTIKLLLKIPNIIHVHILFSLIELSAIPNHPLNVNYLHKLLNKLNLTDREQNWTLPLNMLLQESDEFEANRFLQWAKEIPIEHVSANQAYIACKMLLWFCSSTVVIFRDSSTETAVRLLSKYPKEVVRLLSDFDSVDDPYIKERLYAVACGVGLRTRDFIGLKTLARAVYTRIFKNGEPPPHILIRDYARLVIERAYQVNILPKEISLANCRPPYKSQWPKIIWTKQRIDKLKKDNKYKAINHSMELSIEGGYRNFGHSILGRCLDEFTAKKLNKKSPALNGREEKKINQFIAKRYIYQRIHELGWTPDKIGQQESNYDGWEDEKRPGEERISKKYQWIGLYEILGYISDKYNLMPEWNNQPRYYDAPWQLAPRDIDPSIISSEIHRDTDDNENQNCWWIGYKCQIFDETNDEAKHKWGFDEELDDFKKQICVNDPSTNKKWIVLSGFYKWQELTPFNTKKNDFLNRTFFMHLQSWIICKKDKKKLFNKLKKNPILGKWY